MRCDGSPDPTVQGEINTYINLRLEDTDHDDVESVFKASELDTKVKSPQMQYFIQNSKPVL